MTRSSVPAWVSLLALVSLMLACAGHGPGPKAGASAIRPAGAALPGSGAGAPLPATRWCREGKPTALATQATAMLRAAGDEGLLPSAYDAGRIAAAMERLSAAAVPVPGEVARFESALDAALERYLTDVHRGRVDPRRAGFDYHAGDRERIPGLIEKALQGGDLASALARAEPAYPQYDRLKQALRRYRALATEPAPPLPRVARVTPGDAYAGVPLLAARLETLGDLPGGSSAGERGRYDEALVEAVRRFQARHGLVADGVLGPATFRQLGVPLTQRVRQIELALERLRWLPDAPAGRFIVANVPAFRLWAFEDLGSGRPPLESAIVVGKAARAERARTPLFADAVRFLIFRPYWYPPRSIIAKEIAPQAQNDPQSLARDRLDLVERGADAAPALPPTPENIARLVAGSLRLRQQPGPDNALGLVKFMFPNRYDVYLHDTPARDLFERPRRDFSHGCIRVEKAAELASFLLAGRPEWTPKAIRAAMEGERTVRVDLAEPVPVIIYYTTALVRQDGTVQFFEDVYGLDRALELAFASERLQRLGQPVEP
jgi:murein L,D-transpeptidase YcbB/YkuD